MQTKIETKMENGAEVATAENSKKVATKKSGKVTGVTNQEIMEPETPQLSNSLVAPNGEVVTNSTEQNGTVKSNAPASKEATATKNTAKKQTQKNAVSEKKVAAPKETPVTKSQVKKESQKKAVKSSKAIGKNEVMVTKGKAKSEPQKKAATTAKSPDSSDKKIRLAASCYHYYRFLKDFMRVHVPSVRFSKNPENYNGFITVAEGEKAKGLKALAQWTKENPEVKELFWDVKK